MWNYTDLHHAVRGFISNTATFPGDEMRAFIRELVRNPLAFLLTCFSIGLTYPWGLGIQ